MSLGKKKLENRVKWVRALLSGDYEQGHGTLKIVTGSTSLTHYCCLGVACEVVAPDAKELTIVSGTSIGGYISDGRAEQRFGMTSRDQHAASSWNDQGHASFARIADRIAYATHHDIRFDSGAKGAPEGFAIEWLAQFDEGS